MIWWPRPCCICAGTPRHWPPGGSVSAAILVDEYQDLNQPQVFELLRLLAPVSRTNLFVIGDPNQAIYGFRGARPHYFTSFSRIGRAAPDHLPGRDLSPALLCSELGPAELGKNRLVWGNPGPVPEFFRSARRFSSESASPQAEAAQIAALIDYLFGSGSHLSLEDERLRYAGTASQASFKSIAILYRFHALGQMAQKHLRLPASPVNWPGKPPVPILPASIFWPKKSPSLPSLPRVWSSPTSLSSAVKSSAALGTAGAGPGRPRRRTPSRLCSPDPGQPAAFSSWSPGSAISWGEPGTRQAFTWCAP